MLDMPDIDADPEGARAFVAAPAETARIVRSGTIWTAAGVIAPGLVLGPLLAAGWRPTHLPELDATGFWVGAVAAAIGLALLVWAGCPVLGFGLDDAYRQKILSIRVGICMNVGGMALAGLALLLSPAVVR